jgi:hypothetical protein
MAKISVHVTCYDHVEYGHARVELDSGPLLGWWEAEDGKGRGWGRIELDGTELDGTELSREEAEAELDRALDEYYG